MIQEADIQKRITYMLQETEKAYRYQKSGLMSLDRLVFFQIVEENHSDTPSELALCCERVLRQLADGLIRESDAYCIRILGTQTSGQTLRRELDEAIERASSMHSLKTLHEVCICPIVLGETLTAPATQQLLCQMWVQLQREEKTQLLWQPFLILRESGMSTWMGAREAVGLLQGCVNALREEGNQKAIQPCNRICIISNKDETGNKLTPAQQMKTVLLAAVAIAKNKTRDFCQSGSMGTIEIGDEKLITACAVTISEPIQSLILNKIKRKLQIYRSFGRLNEKHFVEQLEKIPENYFWQDFMAVIPKNSRGIITTEPLWSVMFSQEDTSQQKDRRLKEFAERYYLTPLSCRYEEGREALFEHLFLDAYFENYGPLAQLFECMRPNSRWRSDVLTAIRTRCLQVAESGLSESEEPQVYRKEKWLAKTLREKPCEAIAEYLGERSPFVFHFWQKMEDIQRDWMELEQYLDQKGTLVGYEEVVLGALSEREESQPDERIWKIFIQYIRPVIQNGDRNGELLTLLDELFRLFGGELDDRRRYMERLSTSFQGGGAYDVLSKVDDRLLFPLHLINSDRGSRYIVMGNIDNNMCRQLQEKYGAEFCPLSENRSVDERIEVLRVSDPFHVDEMVRS